MLYIKPAKHLAIILFSLLIVACSSQPKNTSNEVDQDAIIVKDFDFKTAQKRPFSAEELGPNPYLSHTPVADSAIKEFRFAVEALRGGNQDLAEQQLKEMLDNYPYLSGPAYNLAVLKKQQEDIEQAKHYLQIALERNAQNFDALNLQAQILREEGEFDQAEQVYQSIIKAWGGYAPAYRNIGVLYDLYMGRTEEALVYYRQYNYMLKEPDAQVNGWIVDIERRLGIPPLSFDQAPEEAVESTEGIEVPEAEIEAQEAEEYPAVQAEEVDYDNP